MELLRIRFLAGTREPFRAPNDGMAEQWYFITFSALPGVTALPVHARRRGRTLTAFP